MEQIYLSKTLLKVAGGGMHPYISPWIHPCPEVNHAVCTLQPRGPNQMRDNLQSRGQQMFFGLSAIMT